MNKSTPINQLPVEQQKQLSMPIQNEIPNEDDSAIQDILNQINASGGNANTNNDIRYDQSLQIQQRLQEQQQMQQQQLLSLAAMNNMNINTLVQPTQEVNYKTLIATFADDIKLAFIVFLSVIIVHFIPIEKYLSRYLALDKIPYHQIIFRALFSAVIVLFTKKFIINKI